MEIKWSASPNYREGRNGYSPIIIVNHITAGSFPGCLSWMCNTEAQGSAHFLVTKSGEIYQLVDENNTAWANGYIEGASVDLDLVLQGINPNYYSLSIEHEGQPGDTMPEEQYQATLWLHNYLINKYNIIIDNNHIIGHYRLDSVDRPNCPGSGFPWDRLFTDLTTQEVDKMLEQWQIDLGTKSVNELAQKGLIKNPEDAIKELADSIPAWKLYTLINRIYTK
jgi:N-acetyl-anhydromuramyl-L-alanine amidase AmpD